MNIKVYRNYDEMSRAAADLVADYVRKQPAALLCLPSGDTPTRMFEFLKQDVMEGKVNFRDCSFVGLDEWAGMDETDEGSCRHYMDQHLFEPLAIETDRVHFFNGTNSDLQQECHRINEFINEKGPIDLMMVGLGLNGHVGLNEPGVDFKLYSHISDLDEKTTRTAQKYFKEKTHLTRGITLGPRHFLESKVAVLIASGARKAEIVAQSLEGKVSNEVPASIIQRHPGAYVFLDGDAAGLLKAVKARRNEG